MRLSLLLLLFSVVALCYGKQHGHDRKQKEVSDDDSERFILDEDMPEGQRVQVAMEDDEIDEDLSQYTLATAHAHGTFKKSDFIEEGHSDDDDGLIEDAKKIHHNSILPEEKKKDAKINDDNDPDDEAVLDDEEHSDDSGCTEDEEGGTRLCRENRFDFSSYEQCVNGVWRMRSCPTSPSGASSLYWSDLGCCVETSAFPCRENCLGPDGRRMGGETGGHVFPRFALRRRNRWRSRHGGRPILFRHRGKLASLAKLRRINHRQHHAKDMPNQAQKEEKTPNQDGALVRNKRKGSDNLLPLDLTGQ